MADRLVIFDTTLRDGEQAPGFSMRIEEKVRLARQLETLGVDIIEAGFPIASEADAEAVRRVSQVVDAGHVSRRWPAARPATSTGPPGRSTPARRGRIHTFIATSDLHLSRKLRMTREACLDAAVDVRRRARASFTDDVEFSAEDATRSDIDFLCRVVEAVIDAGATTINLPDTVGYSTPDEIAEFFRTIIDARAERRPRDLQRALPRRPRPGRGQHARGDRRGRAAGGVHDQRHRRARRQRVARRDRDGHARARRIACRSRPRIVTEQLYASSQLLSELTGERVQANKAIVGRNAFAHEAGIHQDGMLKDRRTYEIMRPEDVGVPQTTLVLGKHSGRHAVQKRCEQLGLTLSRQDLDEVYRRMVALADAQKHVSDDDLLAITTEVCGVALRRLDANWWKLGTDSASERQASGV